MIVWREPTAEAASQTRLWIALHGSARDTRDMPFLVDAVDPGAGMGAVRGHVAAPPGYAFFARRADRSLDPAAVEAGAAHVEETVLAALADRGAGRSLGLLGFSNGAITAAAILVRGRLPIRAAILLRPMPPALPCVAGGPRPHVLILDGRHDPRRTPADATALAAELRACGFPLTHQTADTGHGPTATELEAARTWREGIGF